MAREGRQKDKKGKERKAKEGKRKISERKTKWGGMKRNQMSGRITGKRSNENQKHKK